MTEPLPRPGFVAYTGLNGTSRWSFALGGLDDPVVDRMDTADLLMVWATAHRLAEQAAACLADRGLAVGAKS